VISKRLSSLRGDDAGFTLVELLIIISLMAVVTSAVAGSLIVFLKTSGEAENKFDSNRGSQNLTALLQADVQSTPSDRINVDPGTTMSCGSTPGTNVLALSYTELVSSGSLEDVEVSYRFDQTIPTDLRLMRYQCRGGTLTSTIVARALSADPLAAPEAEAVNERREVILTVTQANGVTFYVRAASFNKAESLCKATLSISPAGTVKVTPLGQLDSAITVTATLNSVVYCADPIQLVFYPGGASLQKVTMTGAGTTRAVTLPQSDTFWTPGDRALLVTEQAGATVVEGSVTLEGKAECHITVTTSTPTLTLTKAEPATANPTSFEVDATTTGPCGTPLHLTLDTGTAADVATPPDVTGDISVDMLSLGNGQWSWSDSSRMGVQLWREGTYPALVSEGSAAAQAIVSVVPNGSCEAALDVSPNLAKLTTLSNGPIDTSVTVTATRSGGSCNAMEVRALPDGVTASSVPLTTSDGGSTWTATLPSWTFKPGTQDLALYETSGATALKLDTEPFTVYQPCVASSVNVSPSAVNLTYVSPGTSGNLATPVTVDVVLTGDCPVTAGSPLKAVYTPAGSAVTTNMSLVSGSTWRLSLSNTGTMWNALPTTKSFTFQYAESRRGTTESVLSPTGAAASGSLLVSTPNCQISGVTVSEPPRADSTGKLLNSGGVTFTAAVHEAVTGTCGNNSQPIIYIDYTASPDAGDLASLTPNQWSGKVTKNSTWVAPGVTVIYEIKTATGVLFTGSFVMGA